MQVLNVKWSENRRDKNKAGPMLLTLPFALVVRLIIKTGEVVDIGRAGIRAVIAVTVCPHNGIVA